MRTAGLFKLGFVLVIGVSLFAVGATKRRDTRSESSSSSPAAVGATDVDGNRYTAVTIGSQVWMVENLATTRYRDGSPIPWVEDDDQWSTLSTGAYCRPALDEKEDLESYGLLYNFHAVSSSRGLCPAEWHVPSASEWRELINFLGGAGVAGGKMKAAGLDVWRLRVPGTTNESGFTALPAGGRGRLGGAGELGNYATWWSSTAHDAHFAWHWGLHPDKQEIRANPGHMLSGFSVRCLKDRGDGFETPSNVED
jgi:uncharacterized protein (TIGR02145 family)